MKSLRGQLLTATPQLPDENFHQAVVLLIEHNEQGALGVILNRLGDRSVAQLWEEVSEAECQVQRPINLGGPVSGPLMALHTCLDLAEREIIPGLYFSAQKQFLDKLVSAGDSPLRIFLGHSGWGKGQLERELEEGSWLLEPATLDDVFHEEHNLWEAVAKKIGDRFLHETLHIEHLPDDPTMN